MNSTRCLFSTAVPFGIPDGMLAVAAREENVA
jgi:hypothetical protein